MARVAAAVKTGDDQEGIGFDEEEERVGESLRTGSAESFKYDGELPGIRTILARR